MIKWYLIAANSHALKPAIKQMDGPILSMVEFSLMELGHQVYCPREKVAVTRLNRRVKVERALLFQYVFLGVGPGACFYLISKAKGVYRILEDMDGCHAQVNYRDVERFRRNERYGMYDQTKRSKDHGLLKVGSKVRVLEGQFEGYTGIVRRSGGIEKARVFLGNQFVVTLPIDNLADA